MNAHLVARLIEVALCVSPFIGVPLLVYLDPAGLNKPTEGEGYPDPR